MKLLQINGVWVKDPDADSWGPVNNFEWTSGSGRVMTGLMTGSRQYHKYKLPLTWSRISETDMLIIQQLLEDHGDYIPVRFYHRCGYISIEVYSSTVTPKGIFCVNGEVFYEKCTVDLIER